MNTIHGTRARILEEMGLGPEWILLGRRNPEPEQSSAAFGSLEPPLDSQPALIDKKTPPALPKTAPATSVSANFTSWEELAAAIQSCTQCDLCRTRTNTVIGTGDIHADWLFIGEGPGYYEDQQGEPFVGRSGGLLDNMMAALGIRRGKNAYIANIVKCRASDAQKKDRQPTEEEAARCIPYLNWQIEHIKPKIIVALGKTAAVALLNTDRDISMSSMRGKVHSLNAGSTQIPLIVTYHPAYLLRTPMAKKQAWADLCLAIETLEKNH